MPKLNRKAMLLCCAALPALAISTSYAQDDVDDDSDVIVVRGIKKSIQDSLDTKRESNSIVEAISAEDIGRLPDVSIADSLARLPGVTAQRVRGRAQQISIRGLGPDFSIALLNGREQVSAGNNRGIEFDQFPSELIAQGLVYKTPDATLAATGIAGAVDLRTARPLDYSERKINANYRYVFNDQDQLNPDFDRDGYRLFGSYIDQFADGRFGVSLGVTVQSNPTQFISRELKTNRFQVATDPATGLVYPSDNPRFGAVSRDFERTSVAGTLQWQPNDRFETVVDAFYTDTEDQGIFRGVETPIASWSGAQFNQTTGNGVFADTASFDAVVPILRTDTEGNTAEITSLGWNTTFAATERLSFMLDVSRSELDRNDIDYESYAGTGPARSGAQDSLTFNLRDDGDFQVFHQLDYTDPGTVLLTDPGGWGQVGFIKEPKIEDELNQIRLEADYALEKGPFSNLKLGYLYTEREKNFDSNEAFLRASAAFTNGSLAIPSNSIVGETDTGSLGFDIIAYDPSSFLTDGTYDVEKATFDTEWTVEEEVNTFYAMLDVDHMLGAMPLRGNIGFQYVETEQASTGTLAGAGLQTIEDDYSDFLPSMNLALEVAEDTFLRFAAAKSITRARLDQLAANQSLNLNPQVCQDTSTPNDGIPDTFDANEFSIPTNPCFSTGGGNPYLQPYESVSFDLSFEKYFSSATAFAFAVFHKDLSDWVIDFNTVADLTQQIEARGAGAFLDANPQTAIGVVNGPVNFAEGSISGFEATFRSSLGDFFPALEGFGFNASYTYADNQLEDQNGDTTPIPGYSESIWSGDIYYERYGWRARLNARNRSEFLSEVQNFDGSLSGADAQAETILDAQIGYDFDSGPLEGFGILLEAYNITDEPFVTQNDLFLNQDPAQGQIGTFPSRYENYGTTFNLTIRKEF
ncbi:TonB-dependent receptor [Parvularcula lutaonensis]|uniref:TonB-dependent receptor n=1 Tax=Parvularcula lutaonensis TaxID=491923 RepID=A0ABV7MBW5_9PROT|nr:TonB-dependent receptor [Parvularcula lutaonensis]GGY45434.1 TonB-dependent receptor [Parvularcula lutaonensis]